MNATIRPQAWAFLLGCTAAAAVAVSAAAAVAAVAFGAPGGTVLVSAVVGPLAGERVTAERRHRRALAEALRLAGTDELTGLANRRALLAALDEALASAGPVGLMVVDLDGFKTVNDTHSHLVGDHVLQLVAVRLRESTDQSCLVARLGGDEFAVLTPGTDRQTLPVLAARAQAALARPLPVVTGARVTIGTSVGTATSTAVRAASSCTAADLLHRADAAMYRAKACGTAVAAPPDRPADTPPPR